MFLDSFPDEEVDEALQTFEQMVADDPVDFDCEDIDIRENVSIFLVYMYKVWCTVRWMKLSGYFYSQKLQLHSFLSVCERGGEREREGDKVLVSISMEFLCLLHMYMYTCSQISQAL